jgi:type II secretory pathway component PulF
MKFSYQGYDKTGKEVTGSVEAATAADGTTQLRRQGIFVAEIASGHVGGAAGAAAPVTVSGRHLKTLAMFTRQLYVLVKSGTPLAQSLTAIQKQVKGEAWQAVIRDLRNRLEAGCTLHDAMEVHARYFDSIYRGMVMAGESSGKLAEMLERLAGLTRSRLHVRTAVRGAMVYPCLLIAVATGVLVVLLAVVVPKFQELFKSMDVPLPPTTQAMIAISESLRSYWWAALAAGAGVVFALRRYLHSPSGRRVVDTLLVRMPRIGGVTRNFATASIVRLLGVLLNSHVPVLTAMRLTRYATTNSLYTEHMVRAEERVSQGQALSATFEDSPLFSPSVCEAARSGEKSGQVGELLLNMADFLDDENEVLLKVLTSVIEPVILVFMGLVVGLVAVSMFVPLFDLTAMTSGGGS